MFIDGTRWNAAPHEKSEFAAERSLRILAVDADPALLSLCERQMTGWPMQPLVATACNGLEGLAKLGLGKPDLLMTDLHMPELNGFQMLRQLRAMPEFSDITIVVITGLDAAEIEAGGGIPAGILVLPKPIRFDWLRAIATVAAERRRHTKASSPAG